MLTDPLFLTLLIESAALFLLRERDPIFYIYWAAATTLTNLSANLYVNRVSFNSAATFCIAVVAIEILVFICELFLCFLYKKSLKTSVKYSAACNLASFGIGSLILAITNMLF